MEMTGAVWHHKETAIGGHLMDDGKVIENHDAENASSVYVPTLQLTEGQPPPIAAHGGLSYMSFDNDGDAGTSVALEDAFATIAEGEGRRVLEMIDKAPSGPV